MAEDEISLSRHSFHRYSTGSNASSQNAEKVKVVLDTNILISAFLWQKTAKEVFRLAQTESIALCANREILDEFQRVLQYEKFAGRLALIGKTPKEVTDEFLEISEKLVKSPPIQRFVT